LKTFLLSASIFVFAFGLAGCSDDVGSEEEARRAYVGLDKSVDKAIQLGFQGYNLAANANIDPQSTNGTKAGTLTVTGKVDKGSSDNKTMDLNEEMKGYSDDGLITYDTTATLPVIGMKLANVPNGTVTGTLNGTFKMSGELEGNVTLSLSITGDLQPNATDGTKVERKPGTTKITGTAESEYGVYDVNVTQ
jgi:hypothetical protein